MMHAHNIIIYIHGCSCKFDSLSCSRSGIHILQHSFSPFERSRRESSFLCMYLHATMQGEKEWYIHCAYIYSVYIILRWIHYLSESLCGCIIHNYSRNSVYSLPEEFPDCLTSSSRMFTLCCSYFRIFLRRRPIRCPLSPSYSIGVS